ncbi:MAG: S-ribosylhomocysteine lyase [Chloroflexi bacterium]|nr:S-ribosylhomocysteine lyase [Chloroflexota bacterium]
MVNVEELGWDVRTVGELDHMILKAPHVKLRSAMEGRNGDVVYSIDLRLTLPNREYLPITLLHSFEHFLLAGFRKYMPENFVCVAPMGCQTGLYLVLLNEGSADAICGVYENILNDILSATEVPYTHASECGHFENHSLDQAKDLARRLLDSKSVWQQVV